VSARRQLIYAALAVAIGLGGLAAAAALDERRPEPARSAEPPVKIVEVVAERVEGIRYRRLRQDYERLRAAARPLGVTLPRKVERTKQRPARSRGGGSGRASGGGSGRASGGASISGGLRSEERERRPLDTATPRVRRLRGTIAELERRIRRWRRADAIEGVPRATLAAIAACESGGAPSVVSPGGTYRGKYQFTYPTWASVGGSGDPAAASEAEQDRRAALLYAREGSSAWPNCAR
jgi:hypothetical protein